MPHVVLDRKIDLRKFSEEFEQLSFKNPIIRIPDIFIDQFNRKALLPAIVIGKYHQKMLIEINTKENKTTIRLHSMLDPEKTEGVKIALGLVTNSLQDVFPNSSIVRTNISDHIPERT